MDEDTTKTLADLEASVESLTKPESEMSAAETFRREHGAAARFLVVGLCAPPLLASTALGLVVGLALALPGLALAMLAAIPHWIWGRRP